MAFLGAVRARLQAGDPSEAYRMAKPNNGAPGIDGVTLEAIAEAEEWVS